MPVYDFKCSAGHISEERRGISEELIPCPLCGKPARREAIYREQYMHTETGARAGRASDPPLSDIDLRQDVREYQEAAEEVEYAYTKAENLTGAPIKRPDLFNEAKHLAQINAVEEKRTGTKEWLKHKRKKAREKG